LKPTQKKICQWFAILVASGFSLVAWAALAQSPGVDTTNSNRSILIEAAGPVECLSAANTNWQVAAAGRVLLPGDRVRTHEHSRAAVQLSDHSVIRLDERTTLELLAPRNTEKKRFGLPGGAVYFFDREKPADIEFDTPLAAGAIRGTEFTLAVAQNRPGLRLDLIDGAVSLDTPAGEVSLQGGQRLDLAHDQPPSKTALVNVNGAIQWALYYPAVLNPEDIPLMPDETNDLAEVLVLYRSGDLLNALQRWPDNLPNPSPAAQTFHAALLLSVGQVAQADELLQPLAADAPGVAALRELIASVKGDKTTSTDVPQNASGWLARSYSFQAAADLPNARAAAAKAVSLAPSSGFAHARLAELHFAFGDHRAAMAELNRALSLSPRLAPAHALRGFVLLGQVDSASALAAFDRARELDAAYGPAWLGRGLCLLRQRNFTQARASFQAAAALEPQRALFRSYFGKADSELGEAKAAEKEFNLAKSLDPNDPTGWFYSALHLWQENRINEAIRDLEHAEAVNDYRAPFRSRLLLDQDRSVASADLAAIYNDAGLGEVSHHTAVRAVSEDYANFSGHLFLANSLQAKEDVNRLDLRFETARESELLVANLLAPPGAGNLSQQLSQQEHLQYFDPRAIGVSSLSEYESGGNWREAGTVFGTVDGFSYAFDGQYNSFNGQLSNNEAESRQFALTMKHRLTDDDELYLQLGTLNSHAGDVANYYDPAQAKLNLSVHETQEPTLLAGWHHTWSPGSHTLFLFGRLTDDLNLHDPDGNAIFLHLIGGLPSEVVTPPFTNNFSSRFTLYSAELQHIWETPRQSLIIGARGQSGTVNSHSTLSSELATVTDQHQRGTLERGDLYGYYTWRVTDSLQLIGGAAYDHIQFPENTDIAPISNREHSQDMFAPKAGLLFAPWKGGLLRADYTKSLGGLFFDNSVRLEPTQVGGFNQAFRSLIPESVEGLVPGAHFETAGIGFDQSLKSGTFFGIEGEWLTSDGGRTVGTLTNSSVFAAPDSPSRTRQTLNLRERDLSAYAGQLLGKYFAVSARYRLSEAHLVGQFPQITDGISGVSDLEQNNRATLHQLSWAANMNLPCGFFAQWQSDWYHQNNSGYTASLADSDFWQQDFFAGYRFPRRYAEIRLGVLNIFDRDFRLNPLNLYPNLPHGRTFTASFRFNF
jgi:tetratricopeptide (TPR) repeat protein